MRNLTFGYGYASEIATASATTTAAGNYAAENAIALARGDTWKASGTSAGRLILDFGSPVTPTFLGLANCNWSGWGTTKLQHSPDGAAWTDFLTLSGLPSVDSVQDWAAILAAAPAKQFWCLYWAAPSAAPEVGVFYLGTALTLTKNPSYPMTREFVFNVARDRSEGAVVQAEQTARTLTRFDMVWSTLTATLRDEIETVVLAVDGPLEPFWLIPIDESGSSTSGRAYLGRHEAFSIAARRRYIDTYEIGFSFLEEV